MFVGVCVPRVEARDLRPEVPPEQSLVISSGHKASFLMLDVSYLPAQSAAVFGRHWRKLHCCALALVAVNASAGMGRHVCGSLNAPHVLACATAAVCAVCGVSRHGPPGAGHDRAEAAAGGGAQVGGWVGHGAF